MKLNTQIKVRQAFWAAHPELPRKKTVDYGGMGMQHQTVTRLAFNEFLGYLARNGHITLAMLDRATL